MTFIKNKNQIFISNGHSNFFLTDNASWLISRGYKIRYICSFYPKKKYVNFLNFLKINNLPKVERFIARKRDILDEKYIYHSLISELLHQIAIAFFKKNNNSKISNFFAFLSMFLLRVYSALLLFFFSNKNDIYYFRTGYGGIALLIAKFKKLKTVSDHSIVNPQLLDFLINNNGSFPKKNEITKVSLYWKKVLYDCLNSDKLIVNSSFVKDTFNYSFKNLKINVLIPFFNYKNKNLSKTLNKVCNPISIVFAGNFEKRKGAENFIKIIHNLNRSNFLIKIIGNVDYIYLKKLKKLKANIRLLGYMSIEDMFLELQESDIFLFPSLAEGSARVLNYAMLAKNLILTTPNSGSIIKNNINGYIFDPSDILSFKSIILNYDKNYKDMLIIKSNAFQTINKIMTKSSYYKDLEDVLFS